MKKVLWGIGIFLALLPTAYTVYAQYMIRGVRIYLVGTEMGAFLASTWQWTLLASVVLWLPIIIAVWAAIAKKIRSRREIAIPQYEVVSPTQTTRGVIEARGKGQPDQMTELIEPAAPAAETELIEPAAAAAAVGGSTDLLQPIAPQAETVLLRGTEPVIEAASVTEMAEEHPCPEESAVQSAEVPVAEIAAEEPPVEETFAEETPVEEIPAAEPVATEPSAAEVPVEELSVVEPAVAVAEMAAGETVLLQPEMPEAAAQGPRFCGQCGAPVQGKFCSGCGAKTE